MCWLARPGVDTNDEDFSRDAPGMNTPEYARLYRTVPTSRLAQLMQAREQLLAQASRLNVETKREAADSDGGVSNKWW